jgi:transcription elongation factor Elf1
MLDRIEPDKPEYDKRTFECPRCQHTESKIVKYK